MGTVTQLTPPTAIAGEHDVSQFDCGRWLQEHAFRSEGRTARTFVVSEGRRVVGYYCLVIGSVPEKSQPRSARRHGDPKEIPVAKIGRLAVDLDYQGSGLGSALLRDALRRAVVIAEHIGVRAVLVHALDEVTAAFHEKNGFLHCPDDGGLTYFLPVETIIAAL